ncbi:hypothetical protein KDL44_06785 [bacterium]|nr:hypothetical protein [bacterium]
MKFAHPSLVLLFACLLYGASCAGERQASHSAALQPALTELPAELPAPADLPATQGPDRDISAVQSRNGDETFLQSSGAQLSGGEAQLTSTAGSVEWTIYQFDTLAPPPQIQAIDVTVSAATEYLVAIANYSSGRWDFHGPFAASQQISTAGQSDMLSNGSHSYVAVLAYGGAAATVTEVSLSTPSPVTPLWYEQYGVFEDGFSNNVDETMHGLTTDSSDNVYVLSAARRANQPRDRALQVLRYDKDGTRNLAKLVEFDDEINPYDIAVDSSGNIYLLFIYDQLELVKLDSTAALVWAYSYSYAGDMEELTMRIDSEDNLLVCGTNEEFAVGDYAFLAKFDTDGNVVWARRWEHATFFYDVEMAVAGTDIMVLGDAPESGSFEIQYPRVSSFDKDGTHIGSRILTRDTDDEPVGSAWGSESIASRNGKFYVGGMSQVHIDGNFTVVHQILVINPDLSVDRWFSGEADIPGNLGLQTLDMDFSADGDLYMIGNDFEERFSLARFGSDDQLLGAWTISGTTPTSVMVEGEYNQDGHRAVLATAPGAGIFIAGTSIDSDGLTLLPGGTSSLVTMGRVVDAPLTLLDLTISSAELSPVNITDATGVVNTANPDDEDTLVMRINP